MRFIDNTGHIFSVRSYSEFPIGYEYEQTPYIFWIDSEYSKKLSVNNYYILPIRFVVKNDFILNSDENNIYNTKGEIIGKKTGIKITINSDVFKLYCPIGNLGDTDITNDDLVNEINDITKLNCIENIGEAFNGYNITSFNIYTFYIIANSKEEGSFSTNVLINVNGVNNVVTSSEEINGEEIITTMEIDESIYCPITIAGTFVDEIEQLQINMTNIGVSLPKDIIKAVYQYQYNTDVIDENAYNIKLKEYLINHMQLKSECGNYNAVLRAIDWFGWKDKVEIVKHLKTDNQFIEQFINDYFNVEDDIIEAYKNFKTSAYMSLYIKENEENGIVNNYNFNNAFWGEGKPELRDLFNYQVNVEHDGINFIKQYYDYTFNEIGIKLSCMADMLKKYFLPIHLSIKSASIKHQVFANDIKFLNNTYVQITEQPIFASVDLYKNKTFVNFDNIKTYYLHKQENIFIDSNFNVFNHYNNSYCANSTENFKNINNVLSASIPIYFSSTENNNTIYNCNIILENIRLNNGEIEHVYLHTSNFSFSDKEQYKEFVIVPQLFTDKSDISYWEDNTFILHVQCNGVWYKKEFSLKIPDLQLTFAELQYKYESDKFRQIHSITDDKINFICDMYFEDLVTVNNAHFIDEFTRAFNQGEAAINYYINQLCETVKISNNDKYYNRIYIYNITDSNNSLLQYNENDLSIYTDFFDTNGEQKCWLSDGNKILDYDFYLMRDKLNTYYGVFISRTTIDNKDIRLEKTISVMGLNNTYNFTFLRKDNLFLINRMTVIPDNGTHKFNADNLITVSIDNINLPFIFSLGTKWNFKNISIGSEYVDEVTSKTNMAIMSVPNNQVKYAKGYYDITVFYTVDNFFDIQRVLSQRICIK